MEAVTRFVKRSPLNAVHECVLGVLAQEVPPTMVSWSSGTMAIPWPACTSISALDRTTGSAAICDEKPASEPTR
jgi:hypothetical protein